MSQPDDANADPVPLEALLGPNMQIHPTARGLVLHADVIVGQDTASGREYVIYGKPALKRIVETGEGEDLRILRIRLDASGEDLDRLCGLVMFLRGRFDYGRDWDTR